MALTLLRFMEPTRPLLPVSVSHCQSVCRSCAGRQMSPAAAVAVAVAVAMPPSADDYRLLFTETGEPDLRPVILTIRSR